MSYQFGLEGGIKLNEIKPKETSGAWEGITSSFNLGELNEGIGVDEEVRTSIFSKNKDYKEQQENYDAYADMRRWDYLEAAEDVFRAQIDRTVSEGRWSLDENGEVVDSDTSWINDGFMYDKKAIKGALLAQANGYTKERHDSEYEKYSKGKMKEYANTIENAPLGSGLVGTMAQYLYSAEGAAEVLASPTKITSTTLMKTFMKRAGVEGYLAVMGGMGREKRKLQHAAKASLNYGLTDSATNIAIEAGLAGMFSATITTTLGGLSKGKWGDEWGDIDKEIVGEYIHREGSKLTKNSVKHEDLILKTEMDIDSGKKVDIESELEIPIETKLPDDIEYNSLDDSVNKANIERGISDDINSMKQETEAIPEYKDTDIEAKYSGMIDDADGDKLINDVAKLDPEIEAELKALEAEEAAIQAEKSTMDGTESLNDIKLDDPMSGKLDTGSKEYGDMMAEGDAPNPRGFQAQTMNIMGEEIPKTEFDLIQKYQKNRRFNRENPEKKRKIPKAQQDAYTKHSGIADEMEDIEFKAGGSHSVFAQFADNLAAGTVAGVEFDENGVPVGFDPEKFVLGLGGYTAAKQAIKYLAKDGRFKQEMLDYAERRLDEFEATPAGKAITGKQEMYAGGSGASYEKKLAEGKVTSNIYDKETRYWIDDSQASMNTAEGRRAKEIEMAKKHLPDEFSSLYDDYKAGKIDEYDFQVKLGGYAKDLKAKIRELIKKDDDYSNNIIDDMMDVENSLKRFAFEPRLPTDGTLEDFMKHDVLFKEYPFLKHYDIKFRDLEDKTSGYANHTDKQIVVNSNRTDDEKKSIILHEVQHIIQEIEGFAKGGSPEQFKLKGSEKVYDSFITKAEAERKPKLNALIDRLKNKDITKEEFKKLYDEMPETKEVSKWKEIIANAKDPMSAYERLAGEQEARAVQAALKYPDLDPYEALKKLEKDTLTKDKQLPSPIVQMDYADEAIAKSVDDYRMQHTAPEPEGANSGHDMTDVFPDSPSDKNFERYYGTGNKKADKESIAAMKKMEGNPEADVVIYRAAPKGKEINEGDWITLSKSYAKEHGEAHMNGNYEILELKVKAKDVYTNGDSINEWGYYPQGDN